MDEDGWKMPMEEWAHPHQHRYGVEEDFRVGEGYVPGPGMSMEQMMHRMGEYGAIRRGDPRASQHGPAGPEGFYNGHASANGAGYRGGSVKDEMHAQADMMRAMHDAHGGGMTAPNLANSLQNTTLGNYLTSEARAVSAPHRQVLVKVVCNYRRTDDLNPGGRPSPPEATNNRCKTILAFQEGNGTHLCFGMFVKEYNELAQVYIDSVDSTPLLEGENGEDRQKTMTSIVLAYMNHAKLRGFKRLYLRVAPPTDENSFIFTRRLPNDDHHAEEAYRAMSASMAQEQQGAKDLVEVANRLQDRFFCVYLHNPAAKVKGVEEDGIMVESEAMRDRMSFSEVCIRQHLRFNVAEASAKSSRVLIAMISAEQQRNPQPANAGAQPKSQQQTQQQLDQKQKHHMQQHSQHHDARSAMVGNGEEPRQRAGMPPGYMEGEPEMMGVGGSGRGGGRGRGASAVGKELPAAGGRGGRVQSELDMYKDMEGHVGVPGRGMGSMAGMPPGAGHHPADLAAFYGYPSHSESMMSSGYMPSHRMPYGAMHPGYPPEMYGGMEDMKGAHGKHASMSMAHGMGSHLHPDARWAGVDPRMSGRGMWHHPSGTRDVMRGMAMAGRYPRDGVDVRMMDPHGYGYDPSYSGHIGHASHMSASAHEIHMMQGMGGPGAVGAWGGMPPGGLARKLPPGGAGGSSMAAGRSGPGQAGKAGNGKKRGNSAASAGPGGMVGNMSPGMIGNYGGGPDDGAGGVYAEDLPAQEAYEQSGGDRKRSMVGAVADEHGHEGEEDDMAKSKRPRLERDMKSNPALKPDPAATVPNSNLGVPELKDEPGDLEAVDEASHGMLPPTDEPEFLEADSFLAAPQLGVQ